MVVLVPILEPYTMVYLRKWKENRDQVRNGPTGACISHFFENVACINHLMSIYDRKLKQSYEVRQKSPFMDRKTTVFVDMARAKPKSQSC